MHPWMDVLPRFENESAGQPMHNVCPVAFWYVPRGHKEHAPEPLTDLNSPALHGITLRGGNGSGVCTVRAELARTRSVDSLVCPAPTSAAGVSPWPCVASVAVAVGYRICAAQGACVRGALLAR
eukprot:728846-Rhodomonas_salina.2